MPYFIRCRDDGPFLLAGIWERWLSPEGELLESCAIITTQANELVASIHDRMPVIVPKGVMDRWLDTSETRDSALLPYLIPFPAIEMLLTRVSNKVNSPKNDGPDCILAA